MLKDLDQLIERSAELGNHHRKYTHFISRHMAQLSERLEESGAIDEVHFRSSAPDIAQEMDLVAEMGLDETEKLNFLGCYFGFQLLNLNMRAVDVLRLGLSSGSDRFEVYRDFMLQMGRDLRRLTGAYMDKLLGLFLADDDRPEFVICGVGTRADQDDLDLGIIDDGSDRRDAFNHAIGKLQREMLRRAIAPHLHLSEHVGEQSFSASIPEYVALLEGEIQDFIIINEMLGARLIVGSRDLFESFTAAVTDRYYYDPEGDNRYHEGFLRGMMGEVRALLLRKLPRDSVHPKTDALRIIKGLLAAKKTVLGIKEVNAWRILEELMARDQGNMELYSDLEDALSFIEVFRFLYQLLEVQEEEILLKEAGSRAQLESVALLMGYQDTGVVRAYDHLLIHYQEHVQVVRDAALALQDDLLHHLEKISVFSSFVRDEDTDVARWRKSKNIASEFVVALRFFRGTRFWDDVLKPIEENLELLREFVDDFMALDRENRQRLVQRYAKWGEVTCLVILRLLVLLHAQRNNVNAGVLFKELSGAFVIRMSGVPDVIPRMTAVFEHYPKLMNDFLVGLRDEDRERFTSIFEDEVWNEEVEAVRKNLLYFCQLHCSSSHYFKRFLQRTVDRHAEYVRHLHEPARLKVIAKGIFARIETFPTFERKKVELGSYYDLEFLRVGLECREGAPSEQINADFTEFVDHYLESLFDVCKQEVNARAPARVRTRDLLAVYAAGGHGRKLAFDDDYDLIILLDSDDPEIRSHCAKILTRMNSEIIKRGTMPQYRFAERCGNYVTTFSELKGLFEAPDEVAFIDMSQLMGARKIVGSTKFEAEFYRNIVRPYILDCQDSFMSQIAGEIRSRHAAVDQGIISTLDIKETKGGLRDIELMLLVLMARSGLWLPVTPDLQVPLLDRLPHRADDLCVIFESFRYLKHVRDIYRLTVAAEDVLLPEELGYLARILGYGETDDSELGREKLADQLLARTGQVARIVDSLLEELKL
ncbi:hypothetical protein H8E07_18980 [bacterium]|nr:hypothetical protein [bacterium]